MRSRPLIHTTHILHLLYGRPWGPYRQKQTGGSLLLCNLDSEAMYIPSNDKCYEERVFVATLDRVTKEVALESGVAGQPFLYPSFLTFPPYPQGALLDRTAPVELKSSGGR